METPHESGESEYDDSAIRTASKHRSQRVAIATFLLTTVVAVLLSLLLGDPLRIVSVFSDQTSTYRGSEFSLGALFAGVWVFGLIWWIQLYRTRRVETILDQPDVRAMLKSVNKTRSERTSDTIRGWWQRPRDDTQSESTPARGETEPSQAAQRVVAARALRGLRVVALVTVIATVVVAASVGVVARLAGSATDLAESQPARSVVFVLMGALCILAFSIWIGLKRNKEIDLVIWRFDEEIEHTKRRAAAVVAGDYGIEQTEEIYARIVRRKAPRRVSITTSSRSWVLEERPEGWEYLKRSALR